MIKTSTTSIIYQANEPWLISGTEANAAKITFTEIRGGSIMPERSAKAAALRDALGKYLAGELSGNDFALQKADLIHHGAQDEELMSLTSGIGWMLMDYERKTCTKEAFRRNLEILASEEPHLMWQRPEIVLHPGEWSWPSALRPAAATLDSQQEKQ